MMTDKDLVIDALRKLPEEISIEQILEEIQILAAIRRGEQAADAGKVIPHEDVNAGWFHTRK
jgi:predicted transcriptional regulator